jgi:hypothetical protein
LSLRWVDDDGSTRTLDLTCLDAQQYSVWYLGLRLVSRHLQRSAAGGEGASGVDGLTKHPAGIRRAGSGGSRGRLGSSGDAPALMIKAGGSVGPVGGSLGEVPTAFKSAPSAAGFAMEAVAGGAPPLVDRIPGDLFVWGAAHRGPHFGTQAGQVSRTPWVGESLSLHSLWFFMMVRQCSGAGAGAPCSLCLSRRG